MKVIFKSSREEVRENSTIKASELNDSLSIKKLRKLYNEFLYLDALLENEVRNYFESKTNE